MDVRSLLSDLKFKRASSCAVKHFKRKLIVSSIWKPKDV